MDSPPLYAIEHNTIHPIAKTERHGTFSYLFTIWFGCNMNILTVVTGALATTLFGLNFVPACLALVIGTMIGTIFMALHAAQGPQACRKWCKPAASSARSAPSSSCSP
jgi:NCS1 family nucleobase:cation symporter-1